MHPSPPHQHLMPSHTLDICKLNRQSFETLWSRTLQQLHTIRNALMITIPPHFIFLLVTVWRHVNASHIFKNIYIKITKKLQTRPITVTLNHTCAHTFALLRYEHVLTWGGRSFGRSGVWLSVTVIGLVCNFLVFK